MEWEEGVMGEDGRRGIQGLSEGIGERAGIYVREVRGM